jgi:arylsulfatase A-like enzyme
MRAAADLHYEVVASSDPADWTVIATNPGTVGQMATVEDTVTMTSATRRYQRLRVSLLFPSELNPRPTFRLMLRPLICLTLSLLGVVTAVAATGTAASSSPKKPNIIFILTDDLGRHDLGAYGTTFYETPHLDALARSGVRFSQAYTASSVCSPTRASFLTGRYPARVGITDWLPGRRSFPTDRLVAPKLRGYLEAADVTVAESLRAAGYRTAMIGKWHLGGAPENLPEQHGFDLNIGGSARGSTGSYFSPHRLTNLEDGPEGEHLDDRLTRESLAFIREARSGAKPFFLFLSHYSPHTPLQAKPELIAKYQEKLRQHPHAGAEFAEGEPDGRVRIAQTHAIYAAMMETLDTSIGVLLAGLDELGLRENTIVMFTADNGGLATSEGWPTANLPLRTGKGWPYEGGVRAPLLAAWPGKIPANTETAAVITTPDFFPTLLELAGLPLQPEAHLDGRSFAASLLEPEAPSPARTLFWHYPHYSNQRGRPHSALRHGDWKLIEWLEDGKVELYDLSNDLSEARELSATQPERAAALRKELHAWREQVGAQMPTPNPNFQPGS